MKINIGTLVGSNEALKELASAKLPAATAMRVALVIKDTRAPMEAFETAYNQLLTQVGKEREDAPGRYDIVDRERYATESQELLAQEVDVPLDEKISNLGSAELKPATVLALDWLIKV